MLGEECLREANGRHPLNLYAGSLPSYPGEGEGGGEGDTGKDAQILLVTLLERGELSPDMLSLTIADERVAS